jgi:archaellum component FlaC
MSEEIKSVDAKIDEAEAAVKKYASKDTVISIGGYEFTPAKLMIAFTIVTSTLGGLYGCFEVYKDYQDMKSKIAKYVSPDLTEVYKKLAVIEENSQKTSDYTRDIKGDLKNDIRRLEGVVESVERSSKQSQRESDQAVKEVRDEVRQVRKESEQVAKNLEKDVDRKIQRALDNPLAK